MFSRYLVLIFAAICTIGVTVSETELNCQKQGFDDRCNDSYSLNNWMSKVSGTDALGQLAIPGTHNSGSYRTPGDIGECHDWSINQQLQNRIRFLDIRISNNYKNDDFEIRHGRLMLGSFKNLVMNPVKNFLANNPTETILMSIKKEGTLNVGRLERDFIRNSAYKFFLKDTVTPSTPLNEVRGHIVLFTRYDGGSIGKSWKDNDIKIQDDYNLDVECKRIKVFGIHIKTTCGPWIGLDYPKKARKVVQHLEKAAVNFYQNLFWVNFASANYKGAYIGNTAKVSNRAVKNYLQSHRNTPVGSIIPMDYPNRVSGVIDTIIQNNFYRKIIN